MTEIFLLPTTLAVDYSSVITTDLVQLVIPTLTRMLWAIGILVLTRFAIRVVGRITHRALVHLEPTLRKFLVQAAEILTLLAGVLAMLNALQIQTTTVVAVIGAAGLAIGLALQGTLSHFAAGVMLIGFRPFEVGDVVEGAGVEGLVDSIGLFSTTLITADNVRITVPNSNLFTNTLKNKTTLGTRRVDIEIEIGDEPIEPMIEKFLAIVDRHPLVLTEPAPACEVTSISIDNTVVTLRPWCQAENYQRVRSEIQKQVKQCLQDIVID